MSSSSPAIATRYASYQGRAVALVCRPMTLRLSASATTHWSLPDAASTPTTAAIIPRSLFSPAVLQPTEPFDLQSRHKKSTCWSSDWSLDEQRASKDNPVSSENLQAPQPLFRKLQNEYTFSGAGGPRLLLAKGRRAYLVYGQVTTMYRVTCFQFLQPPSVLESDVLLQTLQK